MIEEYVKIDDVIRIIRRRLPTEPFMKRNWEKWFKENEDLVLLNKEVCNLPRADVAPIRHGRWVDSLIPHEEYVCSECGGAAWYYDYGGEIAKSRYCPNCGAQMDGEIK